MVHTWLQGNILPPGIIYADDRSSHYHYCWN